MPLFRLRGWELNDDRILTTAEAAEMVGVNESRIRQWIEGGSLPAERATASRRGRSGWRIKETDLTEFNQRRLMAPVPAGTAAPAMLLTDEDRRADALSLKVIWPFDEREEPFSTEIFDGYRDEFRAVTYTASFKTILWLLTTGDGFGRLEVVFGSHDLLRGEKANPLIAQQAMEDSINREFIAVGGSRGPVSEKLLGLQTIERLRLLTVGPGVVHSKIYLLQGAKGRRVLAGSANLSMQALSGKQGEVLFAFDDHPYMWQRIERLYEDIAAEAKQFDWRLLLKTEIKPAALVPVDEFPAARNLKENQPPVTVFLPMSAPELAPEDDLTYLAVRRAELNQVWGSSIAKVVKPNKDGVVKLTPALLRQVKREGAAETPTPDKKPPPRLDIVNGRFLYQGREVLPPEDRSEVENDAWVITQYFNAMEGLGPRADTMQRNYFGFMGWMFFAPFMSGARRELQKESPKNADYKLMALIYGPANSGKSGLVSFLQSAMFGDRISYSDKGKPYGFNATGCRALWEKSGALPIFFDDVAGIRFANSRGGDTAGETIAKEYDQAANGPWEHYPCLVVAMNADAREFSEQVRKRCLMVYANQSVPEDDAALKSSLNAKVLPLHQRIGTAFYAEYLDRMSRRIESVSEGQWIYFDYLWESTSLIRRMLDESRKAGEDMPRWCQPVGWQQYHDESWMLKREQLKNQLSERTQTRDYPPPIGRWMQDGATIYMGIADYNLSDKTHEYPGYIIDREKSYGNIIAFDKDAILGMLRRGGSDFDLPPPLPEETPAPAATPEPEPPSAGKGEDTKPGLLTRIRRALF